MNDADTDLFGNPTGSVPTPNRTKPRPVTNDMDLIERVLKVACNEGYALLGRTERVYRVGARDAHGAYEVTAVSPEEANAVHQLITVNDVKVGGQHLYRYRNAREAYGRALLVPRQTQNKAARWAALHRPRTWSGTGNTEGRDT